MTCGLWFIGVEVEQETSAPPPKKNPGSAPETSGQEPLNPIMALCLKVLKLFWPLVLTPVDQDCWMLAGNVRCSPANFGTLRLSHKQEVYASDSQMCMCSSEVVYVEKVVCWELWSFEHHLGLLFNKYLNAKFTTWHEFFHSCWVVWWLSGSRHDQLKVSSF